MSQSSSTEAARPPSTARGERRLSGGIILGVPIVLVLVTFLFWYQTWFGRRLTDSDLSLYLQDTSVPHRTQHVLTQVATRILYHDPTVAQVYPQVVALANHKEPGLRAMAAWVMGQDNKSPDFHNALLKLVADPEPMVRWNAALALARFGDATGEPQLRSMLRPYALPSPRAGVVNFRVSASDAVRSGAVVAEIKNDDSARLEVRSPMAGVVMRRVARDGATIAPGSELLVISPDEQQVWQALVALYLVGRPEDLDDVERFARPLDGMSDRVREQAALTAEAIRGRSQRSSKLRVKS